MNIAGSLPWVLSSFLGVGLSPPGGLPPRLLPSNLQPVCAPCPLDPKHLSFQDHTWPNQRPTSSQFHTPLASSQWPSGYIALPKPRAKVRIPNLLPVGEGSPPRALEGSLGSRARPGGVACAAGFCLLAFPVPGLVHLDLSLTWESEGAGRGGHQLHKGQTGSLSWGTLTVSLIRRKLLRQQVPAQGWALASFSGPALLDPLFLLVHLPLPLSVG